MAENQTILEVILQLKDEATEGMKKFSSSFSEAEKASKAFGIGIAAVGAGVVAFGVSSLKAAGEAQAQIASMSATLETMGTKGAEAKESILKMAAATSKLGFDDEDAAVSLAKLFQRTGDLTEAGKLNSIAMDLARAKHMDLGTASNLVGLVMSGNGKILKQYGIDLKDSATPLEALGELSEKVGGQAKAFGGTYEGQMEIMKEATKNFQEEVGKYLLPVLTSLLQDVITPLLLKLLDFASDIKNLTTWLGQHQTALILVAGAIVGALTPALIGLATTLITVTIPALVTAAIALAPFMLGGVIVAGIVAGVLWIIKNWDLMKDKAGQVWDWIKNHIMAISLILGPAGPVLVEIVKGVLWIVDNWTMLQQKATEIWTAVKDFFVAIWEDIKKAFEGPINYITDKFNGLMNLINQVKSMASSVGNYATSAYNSVSNAVTGKASGGSVMGGTPYIVGEVGPELFVPNGSGTIIPNNAFGGSNITVNISGNNISSALDIRNLADTVGEAVMSRLRMNSRISV